MANTFKSWEAYHKFSRSVRTNTRFIHDDEVIQFLNTLFETSKGRHLGISENKYVWRAQLGNFTETRTGGLEDDSGEREYSYEVEIPYSADRMTPKLESAREGRVNPKGIPCLYVANKLETAISETRPWIGSLVSVGQFRTTRKLKLIDFSVGHDKDLDILPCLFNPTPEIINDAVWILVDKAFSRPVTNNDDTAEYIPTQIISEFFKTKGFDGVAYRSLFGKDGYNFAFFDLAALELVNCALYPVESITVSHGKRGEHYKVRNDENK